MPELPEELKNRPARAAGQEPTATLTLDAYLRIKAELEEMTTHGRERITEKIKVAREHGAASHLIDNHAQVEEEWLEGVETVGITSGASAPEELVESLVEFLRERGAAEVSELRTVHEDVRFMLPKTIRDELAVRA